MSNIAICDVRTRVFLGGEKIAVNDLRKTCASAGITQATRAGEMSDVGDDETSKAAAILRRDGVVHLPAVLPDAVREECQTVTSERFGHVLRAMLLKQILRFQNGEPSVPTRFSEVVERDGGRLDVRHCPTEPMCRKILARAPRLVALCTSVLGDDAEVVACGNVVAMCMRGWVEHVEGLGDGGWGDEDADATSIVLADNLGGQAWHADGPHLFDDALPPTTTLPAHALTIFLPLVEQTSKNGPTEFALGTHVRGREYQPPPEPEPERAGGDASTSDDGNRLDTTELRIFESNAGDCIAFDYRCWHRGLPNTSDEDRPMLYLVVAKPWWTDSRNYRQDTSLFCASGSRADGGAGPAGSTPSKAAGKRKAPPRSEPEEGAGGGAGRRQAGALVPPHLPMPAGAPIRVPILM
jgi:hypothetical protein